MPTLQSFTGPSGTLPDTRTPTAFALLQSFTGPSGTGPSPAAKSKTECFNPSQVRLEPDFDDMEEANPDASILHRSVWNTLANTSSVSLPELQSFTGPSGTRRRSRRPCSEGRFNPSQVRLEPRMGRDMRGGLLRFNPSQVRLERVAGAICASIESRFNPSQVRLEL